MNNKQAADEKLYAVQYSNGLSILEDSDPVSKDEAIKLFKDNAEDFLFNLKDFKQHGEPYGYIGLEIAIWEDVGRDLIYRDTLVWFDDMSEEDNVRKFINDN